MLLFSWDFVHTPYPLVPLNSLTASGQQAWACHHTLPLTVQTECYWLGHSIFLWIFLVSQSTALVSSQDIFLRTSQDLTAYLSPPQTAATRWKRPWNLGASTDGESSWTVWCSSHCSRTSTLQLKPETTQEDIGVSTRLHQENSTLWIKFQAMTTNSHISPDGLIHGLTPLRGCYCVCNVRAEIWNSIITWKIFL